MRVYGNYESIIFGMCFSFFLIGACFISKLHHLINRMLWIVEHEMLACRVLRARLVKWRTIQVEHNSFQIWARNWLKTQKLFGQNEKWQQEKKYIHITKSRRTNGQISLNQVNCTKPGFIKHTSFHFQFNNFSLYLFRCGFFFLFLLFFPLWNSKNFFL